MSKRSLSPLPSSGRLRKLLPLLVLLALVGFVIRDPHGAANTVSVIGRAAAHAASSVTTFVSSL